MALHEKFNLIGWPICYLLFKLEIYLLPGDQHLPSANLGLTTDWLGLVASDTLGLAVLYWIEISVEHEYNTLQVLLWSDLD